MPLYHVHITCNNQRAVIAVDHVLEEYGISEQEFVSTWFMDRPEIQGDGDNFEEAIKALFLSLDVVDHSPPHIQEIRHQFNKSVKQSRASFRTPIIGDAG